MTNERLSHTLNKQSSEPSDTQTSHSEWLWERLLPSLGLAGIPASNEKRVSMSLPPACSLEDSGRGSAASHQPSRRCV